MFMKIKVVVRRDGVAPAPPRGERLSPKSPPPWPIFQEGIKKDVKKYVRSRNVYENKGSQDIIPE